MTILSDIESFLEKVRCNFCQVPGTQSQLHEVNTGKKAVANMPEKNGEAIGLLCDQCFNANRKPNFLIQHNGKDIINHINVENLEDHKPQQVIEVKPTDEIVIKDSIDAENMAPEVDRIPKFKDKMKKKQAD